MVVGRGSARQLHPCPDFSADAGCDGLATVRVLAVGGVEALRSLRQVRQLALGLLQIRYVVRECVDVTLEKFDHMMTGGFALSS